MPFQSHLCDSPLTPVQKNVHFFLNCPYPLHLWQVFQQADGVFRVGLVILTPRRSHPQRPRSHRLQHCLI